MRNKVLVIGGGMMGCGIAAIAAAAGEHVTVVETNADTRQNVLMRVKALLTELAANELITPEIAQNGISMVQVGDDLEVASQGAYFVIEAVVENLQIKQQLFVQLDELLPAEVPIVSNTSGLRITDIGSQSKNKKRMATAHFWFPAHLVPLVEVVMSEDTTEETALWVRDKLKSWGKAPVVVKRDLPGQLANRILQAVIREATSIVEMGLATPEDVDTAIKMGMGIRFPVWGALEHVDAVGLDLCNSVQNTVLPGISRETHANGAFETRLAAGNLGYKTGKGFYDWSVKDMKKLERLRNDFIIQSVKFIRNREEE